MASLKDWIGSKDPFLCKASHEMNENPILISGVRWMRLERQGVQVTHTALIFFIQHNQSELTSSPFADSSGNLQATGPPRR